MAGRRGDSSGSPVAIRRANLPPMRGDRTHPSQAHSRADRLDRLDRLVQWLSAEPGVLAAWLFGSRARGDARPDSDVDLAILASAPSGGEDPLRRRLRWILGAAKALGLPDDAVDLVVFPEASPLLTWSVLSEGRLLVDRDPDERVEFQVRSLHRYVEASRLRALALAERTSRHDPGTT